MPHMPEKDPSFWVLVLLALKENGLAMILAFVLTWLRVQYDGTEASHSRKFLEALLGGVIVMVVGLVVKELGLSIAWSFAASGFIGVLGVDQVRQFGRRWAERKVDSL